MKRSTALHALMLTLVCSGLPAQETATKDGRSITVKISGEVSSPASYNLPAGATVLDALTHIGKITEDGDPAKIRLVRAGRSGRSKSEVVNVRKTQSGEAAPQILRDGDTLVVPRLPLCRLTF